MPLLFVVVVGEGGQEEVVVDVEEHVDKGLEQRHTCLFMRVSMIRTLEIPHCHSPQDELQESTLVDRC